MTTILAPPLLLCSLLAILAVASLWLRRAFNEVSTELVDEIDSILPQTQCAQCGYPGCRPYATSIPQGESIDLCVPGGPEVQAQLSKLMQTIPVIQIPSPKEELAFIKEENCIGCALCLPACPVDAIIGAKDYLHTVVADECTGCELCVTACPVDCIVMQENTKVISQNWEGRDNLESQQACVNCVQCDDTCPVNISPLLLHKLASKENYDALEQSDLFNCVECGICDLNCPSNIGLTNQFKFAKTQVIQNKAERENKAKLLARYERHNERLAARKLTENQARSKRLRDQRPWL